MSNTHLAEQGLPMSHVYNAEIASQTSTEAAWIVVLTTSLFFFYEFIQMNIFNVINTNLREAFNLNAIQLGQLSSMYFYANALFLIPAGNLLDRFSTRKLLLFAICICTIGTFFFALATTYKAAAMGRFLEGAGASFCFLSCIRIASRWFPPQKMAFVTGIIVTMAMLGAVVAQTPFTLLNKYLQSWRHGLLINSLLGIIILIATYLIVKDRPANSQEIAKTESAQLKQLGLWRAMKLAALNPQNWLGGLYTSLMNLPVFVLGLWGIAYLQNVHHLTAVQASYATTLFFVGVIFGSLGFGWFSDYIERRILPMILGAIFSLGVILILIYASSLSFTAIIWLFFAIGFITSSQVLTYPTIAELNPSYLTSTAISIDSLCIMMSGFIVPPFFGWLMEQPLPEGVRESINGVTIYTAHDYHQAMLVFPFAFIISLVLTFFMRETRCRLQVK